MINLFQPKVGEKELTAIREVFATQWLGRGTRVRAFERMFAESIGRPPSEVAAVSSCTEGLFQAVAALGVGAGDEIVVPTVSFIGAAHAVRNVGARVVLCDVDPSTLNPSVEQVERVLTPRTKGILVLHYGGAPGAIAELSQLAEARSVRLVEDAACAMGSFLREKACGTFGTVGVWSFDSMKVLTTGDGGMVWSNQESILERIRRGVTLGEASSGFDRRLETPRWWEIDPVDLGRRGIMNDIAAAIGLVQLPQLPRFLQRRSEIAAQYNDALRTQPWIDLPTWPSGDQIARTFYWIQTAPAVRDRLARYLLDQQIYTTFRYWPLHKTRMYRSEEIFPGAEHASSCTLLLPVHQGLSNADVDRIIGAILSFDPWPINR